MPVTVTVSQIARRLAMTVKADKQLADILVRGEISNFLCHSKSGHIYFSLKEGDCSIKAVMFRSFAEKLQFLPDDGMSVIVRASVQLYERDGACQLYVSEIQPDGVGSASLAFEQLKQKLKDEGYFEQKRPIPSFPKKICVITSPSGAAIQDIINVISRRCPVVKLLRIPARVQGEFAPMSIAEAFERAQETDADLIIFGRGGGSAEDLSAFNTEIVAKAIFDSGIPTISAVGHEIDFTIADFVADLRAPTPSAAAELAVPDISVSDTAIKELLGIIREKVLKKIELSEFQFEREVDRIELLSPVAKLRMADDLKKTLVAEIKAKSLRNVETKSDEFESAVALLEALAPYNILKRGYAVVRRNDIHIESVDKLAEGDEVEIRMRDGGFRAVISSFSEKTKGISDDV